jgi:hypothetical protein
LQSPFAKDLRHKWNFDAVLVFDIEEDQIGGRAVNAEAAAISNAPNSPISAFPGGGSAKPN